MGGGEPLPIVNTALRIIDGCFWHGPDQQVDQYRALAEVFLRRRPGAAANEFRATVDEIAALVSEMD